MGVITPKSSILVGFSLTKNSSILWVPPIYGDQHISPMTPRSKHRVSHPPSPSTRPPALRRGADVPRVAEGVDTLSADQLDRAVQKVAIPSHGGVQKRMGYPLSSS